MGIYQPPETPQDYGDQAQAAEWLRRARRGNRKTLLFGCAAMAVFWGLFFCAILLAEVVPGSDFVLAYLCIGALVLVGIYLVILTVKALRGPRGSLFPKPLDEYSMSGADEDDLVT